MSLTVSNLIKRYVAPDGSALTVLDIPSFSVADGEQVALIGTSGSGKTTFLHCLAGILPADSGTITLTTPAGTHNLTTLSEESRDVLRGQSIGYVFQTHHLLPGFTALENVLLGMSFTGRPADPARARHLLTEVGLADRLHYKPAKLSVGQQQRVAVARALANSPSVVLADEPTGALDTDNASAVLALIRKLCQEVKASLILVTHDQDTARQFPRTVNLKDINQAAKK
jgi:putative ABC transport system ATP-binding protein